MDEDNDALEFLNSLLAVPDPILYHFYLYAYLSLSTHPCGVPYIL
jgi:hypothetical protein